MSEQDAATDAAPPAIARTASLIWLTALASVYMLYWARSLLLPIVISILFAYALSPVTNVLETRLRLPRPLSVLLLLTSLLALLGGGVYALKNQAEIMLDKFPRSMRALAETWRPGPYDEGLVDKVQEAAIELDRAARAAVGDTAAPASGGEIARPLFNFHDYVLSGSLEVLSLFGQTGAVFVLVTLLLASGDFYKRRLVSLIGSALSTKKITVQIIDDVNYHIRRYLFVLLLSGILVGVLTWLTFTYFGMPQAALWGVIAGVICLIPYIGPLSLLVSAGLLGLVEFSAPGTALTLAATTYLIANIQGSLLTPWLTSRTTRINRVSLFLGLLFFGWLWGLAGLIVATPVLIIVKVCCERLPHLHGIGELLGTENAPNAPAA